MFGIPALLGVAKLVMAFKSKDIIGAAEQTWGLVNEFTASSPSDFEGILKAALKKAIIAQKPQIEQYAVEKGVDLFIAGYVEDLKNSNYELVDLTRWEDAKILSEMTQKLQQYLTIPGHTLDDYALAGICRKLLDQVFEDIQTRINSRPELALQVIQSYCKKSDQNSADMLKLLEQVFQLSEPILTIQRDVAEIKEGMKNIDTPFGKYKDYESFAEAILQGLLDQEFEDDEVVRGYKRAVKGILQELASTSGDKLVEFLDCVRTPFKTSFAVKHNLNFEETIKIVGTLALLRMVYPNLRLVFKEGRTIEINDAGMPRIAYIYATGSKSIRMAVVEILRYFYQKGIQPASLIIADNCRNVNCLGIKVGAELGNLDSTLVTDISTLPVERDMTLMKARPNCRYHCCSHLAVSEIDNMESLQIRVKNIVEG